ncbi:MAG: hypothetical protein ACXVWU_11610 [Nocardioides sp.]
MDLTVILGPMKSGKSLELVSLLSPLQYSTLSHTVYQSARHVRDTGVTSRSGGALETVKTHDLDCALDAKVDVVGIDEVHMFTRADMAVVHELLARGTRVVAAGLDLDHRGRLFDAVSALLELGPAQVIHRRAVCDVCRDITATHTQVLAAGVPYLTELGSSQPLPDDGTFSYEARCRTCVVLPDQDLPALF